MDAAWFNDPKLDAPTPLTVTDDGRVFGHIALWGSCHIGIPGTCVTPPRSRSGYRYFHLGQRTGRGWAVEVGQITLDTSHPALTLGAKATIAHYDHTGTAVADVRVGEDRWGPWCAGALRPGLDEPTRVALRGAKPSGDWRSIAGSLELVGILAVNVPGFPVTGPRVLVASGAPQALVAAGRLPSSPAALDRFRARVDAERARDDLLWRAVTPGLLARARRG